MARITQNMTQRLEQNGLSKNAQALLAFLMEAFPLYGSVNFQANKALGSTGSNPQTLGEGTKERYIWVHQGYSSKRLQGMNKSLPSIMAAWRTRFPQIDYVTTVQELVTAKLVQERAVKGGFVGALQRDLDEYAKTHTATNGASKSASVTDIFANAQSLLAKL